MRTSTIRTQTSRVAAAALAVVLLLLLALPVRAEVNVLRNAFNPRGFFLTVKSTGEPQWLRSPFVSGFYRAGEGGQGGGGGGNGANAEKDDLGHSNLAYNGEETGLDYIDAADVDTIYSTYDHNPTPGKDFMIGYYKDEAAASLMEIPNFTSYIGTPGRGASTVSDPSGGQWWNVPIRMTLGEENENGSADALAPGTLYEFAYLRGNRANNGTTCVLMPGDAPGTYKGYVSFKGTVTEEEQAVYDAHKYDEYEFITGIYPEGSSGDATVDHTIQSVPMRYHIQTFAKLSHWTDAAERSEAAAFLASVQESDYVSGKYVRENVQALKETLAQLDEEAETSVKYQLQKDAERTILEMIEDLKQALETAKLPQEVKNFDDYNAALTSAKETYENLKDKKGTAVDQYLPGPVDALKTAIDHAETTISGSSAQADIDLETRALQEARLDALDALVRPEERIFQDDPTGIIVTSPIAALPDNARLAVREVVSTSNEYASYVSRISPKPDAAVVYRIVFYDGTNVVAPTQPVTVQIPLQDQLDQTAPSVYYLDDMTAPGVDLNASAASGYRTFTTTQMGTFAVAGQKQAEPEQPLQPEQPQTPQTRQQPVTPQPVAPAPVQNNNSVHRTTARSTTRPTTQRTTRIIRTTRDPRNDQNQRNEVTSTSVLQTQAVQPTTMTTTAPAPTVATDTSDLEQEADPNTLLYIALAIAAVGIGTLIYQLVKDGKLKDEDNEDAQL